MINEEREVLEHCYPRAGYWFKYMPIVATLRIFSVRWINEFRIYVIDGVPFS